VRASWTCRRNKDDPKNDFLTELGAQLAGDVILFSADLVTPGAYDDACANADAVIHAAAQVDPFVVVDPIKDMVEPSTEGVKNILSSVNKCPNVKHFVHTSSIAAVGGAAGRPVTEADWNTQGMDGWEDAPALAYNYAKAEGERTVWAETKGKPYTVSAINPAMVWGPCLAKAHAKASPFVFRQALYGNDQPNGQFSVVDVRDVALAHVLAMENPEANGKRFILDGDGYKGDPLRSNVIRLNDVIAKCREYFPQCVYTNASSIPPFLATNKLGPVSERGH
jgi:nucleoside-diphosphate-sugar epimerase